MKVCPTFNNIEINVDTAFNGMIETIIKKLYCVEVLSNDYESILKEWLKYVENQYVKEISCDALINPNVYIPLLNKFENFFNTMGNDCKHYGNFDETQFTYTVENINKHKITFVVDLFNKIVDILIEK